MRHNIVLNRVTYTEKMIFLGFKEVTMKESANPRFLSQQFSTRYASVGDLRVKLEDRVNKAKQKFGFSVDTKGNVVFEDKEVTLQDILSEFSCIKAAIVYEYIGASVYEGLSEQDRKAYQPAFVAKSNFYQTNPDTGEVLRDENGRAIIQSQGAGVFTNSLGEVVFRTSVIRPEEELANESKLKLVPFDQEVVDMLEEYPAALDAINSRLGVAQEAVDASELAV